MWHHLFRRHWSGIDVSEPRCSPGTGGAARHRWRVGAPHTDYSHCVPPITTPVAGDRCEETRIISISALSVLIAFAVVLDIVTQFTPLLINIVHARIGVAMFAVGVLFVFQRRFLAVQRTSSGNDLSIYLDERGRIRDYSATIGEVLPELAESTGDRLFVAVSSIAKALDSDDRILEHDHSGELRYYLVSTSTTMLGDAGAQVVRLSDVTRGERQRRQLVEHEAELEGQPVSVTLSNEATVERAWDAIDPMLNGERMQVRDFPLRTKAGATVFTDIRGVPTYRANVPADERTPDDIAGIQSMVRDATNRREREGLISVINRVLRHNMRNKMAIITGYAEMLEGRLGGDNADKVAHLGDTAGQLVDLTESAQRIEENRELSPDFEPINLEPIVEDTALELRMQYPEASVTVTEGRVATAVRDNGSGLPEIAQDALQSNLETPLAHRGSVCG